MVRHISLRNNEFDGSPLVTVKLDAADVEQIYSALADSPADAGAVQWWKMIHGLMNKFTSDWAEQIEGEE